ncbi:MAG: M20/M25/M40 family metallo-hydrolase [Oscillospiraceae bacterium]|nr:M20/M25/M40 family metallo-hydrolase [Oscillospiraceae bacterium]
MALLYILLGLLGLFLALLLVAVVRAVRIKAPAPGARRESACAPAQLDAYARDFGALLRVQTVSKNEDEDLSDFARFHEVLEKVFPLCAKKLERTVVRGALLYRWAGADPGALPILFMGHQDVVPAQADGWTLPPYAGEVKDGRLYGRGALDCKCNIFTQMSAVEQLLAEGFVPPCDVWLEYSINEETGGDSAPGAVRWLKEHGLRFSLVLDEGGAIIERAMPGMDRPYAVFGITEKGYIDIKVKAKGNGGHSSTPPANTPVMRLAKFMTEVGRKMPFKKKLIPEVEEMFAALAPSMGFGMRLLLGNVWLFRPLLLAAMPKVSPLGGALLATTCTFTMMKGSDAPNVIPQEAYVVANLRTSVQQNCEQSIAALKPIADKYGLEFEITQIRDASPVVSTKTPVYAYLTKCVADCFPDCGVSPYVIMGGTDCRHFHAVTDNAIRFAPLRMDAKQMESCHAIDENVTLTAVAEAIDFYKYFVKNYQPEKKPAK